MDRNVKANDAPTGSTVDKLPNIEVWREALAQLRHLSDEVWKSFRLFFAINGFVIAILIARLATGFWAFPKVIEVILLSLIGIAISLAGRYLLLRHRVYYLQMLAKKSLLEMDLGFYNTKLNNTEIDLAFPWRLTPEVVKEIQGDFEGWVKKSIRSKGTIAKVQFWFYEGLLAGYFIVVVVALFGPLA